MFEDLFVILVMVVGFAVGLLIGYVMHRKALASAYLSSQEEAKKVLDDARREADRMVKNSLREAKEESKRRRKRVDEEGRKRKNEVLKIERKMKQREQSIEERLQAVADKDQKNQEKEKRLEQLEKQQLRMIAEHELAIQRNQQTLERTANMSADEARRELMDSLLEVARKEARSSIREVEEQAKIDAIEKSRAILSVAVQRIAGEYVNDATVTVISLPSEDMKGRIIGREGRNIRAIEQATGVDLIIDDTPEAVIVSCFNPMRREIAKLTLERLIADGRIHPARIEETARRVEAEFETTIREFGEQASFDVGITDLHPDIVIALGRLHFRTEGGQTTLKHSVETARIAQALAGELGSDSRSAKRAALLHDIGKSLDHEYEGHHADVGADFLKKYGESPEIVHSVRAHHLEDIEIGEILPVIVQTANALSSERPGARRDKVSSYVQRLEHMETIVGKFEAVESSCVIQAGREVRALVTPFGMSDQDVRDLAGDIAASLREELNFPGQVKVTVIKESRYVDYAK